LWIGAQHPEEPFVQIGQVATAGYFGYFLIMVPLASLVENTLIDIATYSKTNKGFGSKNLSNSSSNGS
jgi:ubiquinol-cytochrome c reductase cytochrome b subunit